MYPVKSLYVGDLDSGVQEDDLLRAFSRFDGLATVRLCRDRISRRSLCYAYVNYRTHPQAERAMRAMNHTELKGKPMRIMWIKRDPYSRKTGVGNLYVKNLELLVRATDLERVFSEYGSVLSCKVVYDECTGRSRQFGFVQMCSDEVAQKAINALHDSNSTCLSKSLYVVKFVKKGSEKKNLYIKNLEESITNEVLREKFSQFGQVASAVVMRDKHGNSKGFGFVSFEQSQDAYSALSAMNGSAWGSMVVFVSFAQKKAEREALLKQQFADKYKEEEEEKTRMGGRKGYGVYVANLEESVSAKDLWQLFESCGKVISAKVALDPSRRSRGFGFVYLSTLKGAQCALSMDGMSILKSRPIIVKRALSKRGCNKYAGSTKSTTCSHAATGGPIQPFSYQPYHNVPSISMYNVQSMDQNLWANNSYTVPFLNYVDAYSPQPAITPVGYYDPSMQYIQQQVNTPASGWEMGCRALSLTPMIGAYSNSGKRKVTRAKTNPIQPRRPGKRT